MVDESCVPERKRVACYIGMFNLCQQELYGAFNVIGKNTVACAKILKPINACGGQK